MTWAEHDEWMRIVEIRHRAVKAMAAEKGEIYCKLCRVEGLFSSMHTEPKHLRVSY